MLFQHCLAQIQKFYIFKITVYLIKVNHYDQHKKFTEIKNLMLFLLKKQKATQIVLKSILNVKYYLVYLLSFKKYIT